MRLCLLRSLVQALGTVENIQTAHILPLAGFGIHCAAQAGSTPVRGSPGSWAPAGTIPHFLAAMGRSSPHYTTATRRRFPPSPAALIEPLPAAQGPLMVFPLANPFHGEGPHYQSGTQLYITAATCILCPTLPCLPSSPSLVRCLAGIRSGLWALPVDVCTELYQKGLSGFEAPGAERLVSEAVLSILS